MHSTDYGRHVMDRVDHPGWWMFVGMLFVVALWSLLIWLVLSAVRRNGGEQQTGRPSTVGTPAPPPISTSTTASAEQILAERLARGEIDPDDYRHRLDTLRTSARPSGVGADVSESGT